jgi:hypothetical protein
MDGFFNYVSQERKIQKEKKRYKQKEKNEIRLKSFLSKDTK